MEKTAQFVHLRLHSEYSLVDSVLRISDGEGGFCRVVRERGMPAVALTGPEQHVRRGAPFTGQR